MGLREKKLPENAAQIVVCENNFHGRTTTIVSFQSIPMLIIITGLLRRDLL